jgi:hypothetical protein
MLFHAIAGGSRACVSRIVSVCDEASHARQQRARKPGVRQLTSLPGAAYDAIRTWSLCGGRSGML